MLALVSRAPASPEVRAALSGCWRERWAGAGVSVLCSYLRGSAFPWGRMRCPLEAQLWGNGKVAGSPAWCPRNWKEKGFWEAGRCPQAVHLSCLENNPIYFLGYKLPVFTLSKELGGEGQLSPPVLPHTCLWPSLGSESGARPASLLWPFVEMPGCAFLFCSPRAHSHSFPWSRNWLTSLTTWQPMTLPSSFLA